MEHQAVKDKLKNIEKLNQGKKDTIKKLLKQLLSEISANNPRIEEIDHKYEQQLGLIADSSIPDIEGVLNNILYEYDSQTDNNNLEILEQTLFNAFYALHIYYRHQFASVQLEKLFKDFNLKFKNKHPITAHLEVLTELNVRQKSNIIKEDLIELADENYSNPSFATHVGVAHAFADVTVTVLENKLQNEYNPADLSEEYTNILSKYFEKALKAVDFACKQEPEYGKFYTTKARLISLGPNSQKKFTEAKKLLFEARGKETPNSSNHSMRIAHYLIYETEIGVRRSMQLYSLRIKAEMDEISSFKKQLDKHILEMNNDFKTKSEEFEKKINTTTDEFRKEVNQASHKNIEYLALFSALICIFVTATNKSAASPIHTCGLIGVLFGCLTCLFVIFNTFTLLRDKRKWNSLSIILHVSSLILGILLIATGFLIIIFKN